MVSIQGGGSDCGEGKNEVQRGAKEGQKEPRFQSGTTYSPQKQGLKWPKRETRRQHERPKRMEKKGRPSGHSNQSSLAPFDAISLRNGHFQTSSTDFVQKETQDSAVIPFCE